MIGSTFKMNVSNPKEVWGGGSVLEENEGTVNVGNYGEYCMFRVNDNVTDVELIPNNAVFRSLHRCMNLAFTTQIDANRSYCTIEVEGSAVTRYASRITIYNVLSNRDEWPYALTLFTELEAVY